MHEWQGKEIHYPADITFVGINGESVLGDVFNQKYKVFSYIDSIGCVSCKLKLSEWKKFISMIDSLYPNTVCFQFVFQPYKYRELQLMLKREKFSVPVCIDKNGKFEELNKFPLNIDFQTFLLDKENKVLAIGNPVHNPKVKELYMKIIQGKGAVKEENTILTKIQVKKHTISLGRFNWQEEQKAQFMIYNVGNRPLVINDVTTSCGCTSVDYSKQPVSPGDSVSLQVAYKADHPEHFDKTITVYCNTNPSLIRLRIIGDAE